jgi:DNA repair photolyase
MIAIGTNTDPYQPIERKYQVMRRILEVLERRGPSGRHRHQVGAGHARHRHSVARWRRNLAKVALSVTTLDPRLARAWSRARRRPRGGWRRSERCPMPAFRRR